MIQLNDDGVSVKGCKHIHAPRGQAGEYAPLAANPYRGCGHACAYCWVPLVTKQDRAEFNAGALPRRAYLAHLRRDAVKKREIDWRAYTLRMLDTLSTLGARWYVKRDRQPYLPPGVPNPLRVKQHH